MFKSVQALARLFLLNSCGRVLHNWGIGARARNHPGGISIGRMHSVAWGNKAMQGIYLFFDSDLFYNCIPHFSQSNYCNNNLLLVDVRQLNKIMKLYYFYTLKAPWDDQGKMKIHYGMSRVKKQLSGKRSIIIWQNNFIRLNSCFCILTKFLLFLFLQTQ